MTLSNNNRFNQSILAYTKMFGMVKGKKCLYGNMPNLTARKNKFFALKEIRRLATSINNKVSALVVDDSQEWIKNDIYGLIKEIYSLC
ncbi:MAG: hypothetical protein II575_08475 [Bacteroidales bacterium]|nr:hypothetical protein [Bacteroidales bacterium]